MSIPMFIESSTMLVKYIPIHIEGILMIIESIPMIYRV